MHSLLGLPFDIARGLEGLLEGDDIPRHERSRHTLYLYNKAYFWVIRNGKHTLLRGKSPYEIMTAKPENLVGEWDGTAGVQFGGPPV